ncbi:MAG: hypothetical protein AB1631_15765 [Acidobacteriota bacterium]
MAKIFPQAPIQRLVNTHIPDGLNGNITNPLVSRLHQIPGFGNEQCTPQMAGIKLRESFASVPAPALIEHCAHAKRWVKEHITSYIDGKLPTIIRKFKYAADIIKIIRYIARVVATLNFLVSLLRKELALALAWAQEMDAFIEFAESNLTPAGLRTQAEQETAAGLARARQSIARKVQESTQSLACLI